MIATLFKMSKDKEKEEENIFNLNQKDYLQMFDVEAVPYLNNNGDGIQDILDIVKDNTNDLQMQLISDNDDNVVEVDFRE